MVIPVLPKTSYTMTSLGASVAVLIPVAINVSITSAKEVVLIVRVHSVTWSNNAEMAVELYGAAPTEADPAVVFQTATKLTNAGTTQAVLGSGNAMMTGSVSAGLSPFVNVVLKLTQGNPAAALVISVSAELEVKM